MVGYGSQIDDDVASEIWEAYVVPTHRGRAILPRLVEAARPLLREPWGFQVLVANARTWRCIERMLTRRDTAFSVREVMDDGVPVCKYRLKSRQPLDNPKNVGTGMSSK